jgi:hypothetical protein
VNSSNVQPHNASRKSFQPHSVNRGSVQPYTGKSGNVQQFSSKQKCVQGSSVTRGGDEYIVKRVYKEEYRVKRK